MWRLFKGVNLLYLLVTSNIWFTFVMPIPGTYVPLLVSIFMIICFALGNFNVRMTQRVYALFGLIVLYTIWTIFIQNVTIGVVMGLSYLPAALLFMLDKPHQSSLLKFITKWVAIILAVSIFFYLVGQVVNLPHVRLSAEALKNYSAIDNYFFFLKADMYNTDFNVVRFSGPFLEPGHQAMICAILLFANRFQFSKNPYLWILLVSILMSFSLAGYVMLLLGLIFVKMKNIFSMIGLAALISSAWIFVTVVWDAGDNPVSLLIVDRLQFDENKGIAGNNRTVKQTDWYFSKCVEDGTIWTGVQSLKEDKTKIRGAGYKIFLLRYGVISALFIALYYIMLIPPKANKRYAWSFFVFLVIVFMQRAYPWWYSWLLPYVLGIGISRGVRIYRNLDHIDKKEKKKKKRRKLFSTFNNDKSSSQIQPQTSIAN